MVNITLDNGEVNGSITISATLVYGTQFSDKRFNQSALRIATGEYRVYDTGNNVVMGEMVAKNVSYEDGELLRAWIREKIVFQLKQFSIVLDTSCEEVNLGNGKGIDIVDASFTSDTDKSVFKYSAPGLYKLKFPYTYVRS